MINMEALAPGGWDLDEYDTFEDWTSGLKLLGNSSRVAAAVTFVYGLRIRFERLCTVADPGDGSSEDDDEEDEPPSAPAFAAGTAALRAARTRRTTVAEVDEIEIYDQEPKVLPSPRILTA